MAIFELTSESIFALSATSFWSMGVKERGDLQRILRDHIGVVAPAVLVITEEFGDWQDSKRRIDILGLDSKANLVVIELKRTDDGGHMELQAIRYAAMVSAMTFDQVVATHEAYLAKRQIQGDARTSILEFLDWTEPDDSEFAQNVRIVLVAEDFSKEVTTTVMWLNQHDLDVTCVRLKPYHFDGRLLIDVQQTIPLPEAAEFQVQIKNKTQLEKVARESSRDYTRFDVTINGILFKRLPKRTAIWRVVKSLCDQGASPEEVAKFIPDGDRRWKSVSGEVSAEDFRTIATGLSASQGSKFDESRWFAKDDELIRVSGKTYAFSNQWGTGTAEIMTTLVGEFPNSGITVCESDGA